MNYGFLICCWGDRQNNNLVENYFGKNIFYFTFYSIIQFRKVMFILRKKVFCEFQFINNISLVNNVFKD